MLHQRGHFHVAVTARRVELFMTVAVGYVRRGSDRIEQDPDLRVREALALVFRKFAELQSVRQVHVCFRQEGITLPAVAERLETPLYELLEEKKLGRRKDLTASEMTENLGTYLTKDCSKSGLTKEDYGKTIGVSLPQLYILLRGNSNPSWLVIVEIANRLEIDVWRLLGVTGSKG